MTNLQEFVSGSTVDLFTFHFKGKNYDGEKVCGN